MNHLKSMNLSMCFHGFSCERWAFSMDFPGGTIRIQSRMSWGSHRPEVSFFETAIATGDIWKLKKRVAILHGIIDNSN